MAKFKLTWELEVDDWELEEIINDTEDIELDRGELIHVSKRRMIEALSSQNYFNNSFDIDNVDIELIEGSIENKSDLGKICDDEESGCDHDCRNCDVPGIEPEDCQNCLDNAKDSGFEYEANFIYKNDCWHCENCGQPV